MEHMESKMQDFYEGAEQWQREAFDAGFKAGMIQAVWSLRNAALTHEAESVASKKVVESQANLMAARLLRSYANGLEMEADRGFQP